MSHKIFLTLGACSLIVLSAACGSMENSYDRSSGVVGSRADTTENILAAEGSWAMVEERQSAGDPLNLHSNARKQVNPANKAKRQFIPEERLAGIRGGEGQDDVHFRLVRIEREVNDLRDDFDKLLPPLSNLIVSDNQLDRAIGEIMAKPERKPAVPGTPPVYNDTGTPSEVLLNSARNTQTAQLQPLARAAANPAPASQQQQQQAAVSAPAASGGATVVRGIRTGEHPGKTRLVLDLTGASKYRADIDNDENLLLIELSDAGWQTASQKALNHPLIRGYSTQAAPNGGTILALELKKPARILGTSALKPNSQYGNRIYLDLAAS